MQNVCDGRNIKHGLDFSCVCDAGHTVQYNELFMMRKNNRNGQPDEGVCAIYDIQFTQMNCLRLGGTKETVSQIKVCAIEGKQFTRMNYLR